MVDLDAAIGYVVAHGDTVDRARLAWLRSGIAPPPDVLDKVELGSTAGGGWPAFWGGDVASVDATCFRLGELDDLGALERPAARRALTWLAATAAPRRHAGRKTPRWPASLRRGPSPATRRPAST